MAKSKYRDHEKPLNETDRAESVDQFPPNVVVAVPAEPADFGLEPPTTKSAKAISKELTDFKLPLPEQDRAAIEDAKKRREQRQFSIGELMWFCTIMCVGLGVATSFGGEFAAFVLGSSVVILTITVLVRPSSSRFIQLAWIALLALYLVSAILAATLPGQ